MPAGEPDTAAAGREQTLTLAAFTSAELLEEVGRRLCLERGEWIVTYGLSDLHARWIDAHRPPERQPRERGAFLRLVPEPIDDA